LTDCRHDDPRAMAELSGSWRWASSGFQVDGKDGAVEPSGVVESSERKITPYHMVGGALHSGVSAAEDHSEAPSQMSNPKLHSELVLGGA